MDAVLRKGPGIQGPVGHEVRKQRRVVVQQPLERRRVHRLGGQEEVQFFVLPSDREQDVSMRFLQARQCLQDPVRLPSRIAALQLPADVEDFLAQGPLGLQQVLFSFASSRQAAREKVRELAEFRLFGHLEGPFRVAPVRQEFHQGFVQDLSVEPAGARHDVNGGRRPLLRHDLRGLAQEGDGSAGFAGRRFVT